MTCLKNNTKTTTTTTTSRKVVSFVHLEHSRPKWSKFWKCQMILSSNKKTVTMIFGKSGTSGRKIDKTFKMEEEAKEYFQKQVNSKRKLAYKDAKEKNDTMKTRRRSTRKKSSNKSSSKLKNIVGHNNAPDLISPDGGTIDGTIKVDSSMAELDFDLASRSKIHHDTIHAHLALINNKFKNSDKYHISEYTELSVPTEWDHDGEILELSDISHEDASKVLEQWQTDQDEDGLDIIGVNEHIGSNLLDDDDVFGGRPCVSPTTPLEELVYMNIDEDIKFFTPHVDADVDVESC